MMWCQYLKSHFLHFYITNTLGESASLSGLTKRNANAPSFPSKTERIGDSSVQSTDTDKSASARHWENNDCLVALPSKANRGRRAQHETGSRSDVSSVSPSPNRQTTVPSHGLRLEELESMAKDIQQFNPKDSEFKVTWGKLTTVSRICPGQPIEERSSLFGKPQPQRSVDSWNNFHQRFVPAILISVKRW